MTGRQNLLIHFFDREVLDLEATRGRYDKDVITAEFRSALKTALLFTPGRLLLPLSSYFESDLAYGFADEWGPLFAAQELHVVASEPDHKEFIETKREQYKREPGRHPGYYDKKVALKLHDLAPSLMRRGRSSTADIGTDWRTFFSSNPSLLKTMWTRRKGLSIAKFERAVMDTPVLLGGDAFIWPYVRTVLPVASLTAAQEYLGKELISRSYIRSYLGEFDARVPIDLRVGQFRVGLGEEEVLAVGRLRQILILSGFEKIVAGMSWDDAVMLKHDPAFGVFAGHARVLAEASHIPRRALEAFANARRKNGNVRSLAGVRRAVAVVAESLRDAEVGYDATFGGLGGAYVHQKRDLSAEFARVLAVKRGRPSASEYEAAIAALFAPLFDPVLTDAKPQDRLYGGRKRVDLTLLNRATTGFFSWLRQHKPCNWIFVECKNYNDAPGNPELDQLAMRLSPERGMFGLLACRTMDLDQIMRSCSDIANGKGGLVVPLQDADIAELVRSRRDDDGFFELPLVMARFRKLVGFA